MKRETEQEEEEEWEVRGRVQHLLLDRPSRALFSCRDAPVSEENITRVSRNLAFAWKRNDAMSGHFLLVFPLLGGAKREKENLRSTLVLA